jgi:hypothetical protein
VENQAVLVPLARNTSEYAIQIKDLPKAEIVPAGMTNG